MNGKTARLLRKTVAAMVASDPQHPPTLNGVKRVWNHTPRTTRDALRPAIAAIFKHNNPKA